VDEVTDLPGCDTLSNPRRSDTACPFKYEPLRALTHLQAFLNSVLWIASDEMGSDHCLKLEKYTYFMKVFLYVSQHTMWINSG
jgi:hypothetical protein